MRLILAALLLVCTGATGVQAQSGRPGDSAFQLRFGGFFPSGEGEVWETNEEVFTLKVSDFDDFIFGMTFVKGIHNKLELGFNLDLYSETSRSAYRDFVDEAGFPILHDTKLQSNPLTVDLRFLPWGRYRARSGGRYVVRPAFYIGGGGGVTFWKYEEVGDFLDFTVDPPEIFGGRFQDDGTALLFHVVTGVELPVSRSFHVFGEARYFWAEKNLGGDLAGLGDLDLGGLAAYFGMSWRF